jgi:hypothetical protein
MKKVTIHLQGGVGNQLFQYIAGKWLSIKLRVPLVLDTSFLRHLNHKSSSIFDFQLDNEAEIHKLNGFNLPSIVNHADHLLKVYTNVGDDFVRKVFNVHKSRDAGFDIQFEQIETPVHLFGYFQSYKYFSRISPQITESALRLRSTSDWFTQLSEEAVAKQPIALHFRRGDYQKPNSREFFGILSPEYYLDALESLQSNFPNREVWVFSDSIEQVKAEFSKSPKRLRFIEPPNGSAAAESLRLMALGSAIVISNSTFSYWAAVLSGHSNVIAPSKWFRGSNDPLDLYPPSWSLKTSIWK